jgi:uncharacterized Zn-binding protein involved in type VI secretion
MRGVIRLGDPTTHGGKVTAAAGRTSVLGQPVARVGDACACPVHGACLIVEGQLAIAESINHPIGVS